jgi:rSAM/selenodomain-associated transferase 2
MKASQRIAVIIPALNEEAAIGHVLDAIPRWIDEVVIVDNGCTDTTASVARGHGATVVREPRRGYGAACLRGLVALNGPDIVVFLDADNSDDPSAMDGLVEPIVHGQADLVIGSRTLGRAARGALTWPQRFGNVLASTLIRGIWGQACTDLGPFRAIRFSALLDLGMNDLDYGWTVQMQARAFRRGLRVVEIPVSYRKRIGQSKISGTVRGVVGAGTKILTSIACEAFAHSQERSPGRRGTADVLIQTREKHSRIGIRIAQLDKMRDVDTPADFSLWQSSRGDITGNSFAHIRLSIIIPALNEADFLYETISSIGRHPDLEVIVVDGGSADHTCAIADACSARVIRSAPGRARQMNAGAAVAKGEILLFLHADTRLPFGYSQQIESCMAMENVSAGAFRFALDDTCLSLRLVEIGANWRSKRLQFPFGDQGIFLRRETFERVGQFRILPAMEDYDLVSRLRKQGKIALASSAAITSARRWLARGVWRTTITHFRMIIGWKLGFVPQYSPRWRSESQESAVPSEDRRKFMEP